MPVKRTIRRDLREDVQTASRIWSKVTAGDSAQCWPWQGAKSAPRRGLAYGKIAVDGVTHYVHRVVWAMTYGPVPDGMRVLHTCDNPPCCNPAHLFLGTHADNMRDREAKGRHNAPRGSGHAEAKLTEEAVATIRLRCRNGERQNRLAAEFGVTPFAICAIVNYRSWKHVP